MAATFLLSTRHRLMLILMFGSLLQTRGLAPVHSSVLEIAPSPVVSGDTDQCWSLLENIPGCKQQLYGSLFSSQYRIIRPACCRAITESTPTCKPKLFPSNPIFPTLLDSTCPLQSHPPSPNTKLDDQLFIGDPGSGSAPFPISQPNQQIWQCFGAILNTQGCAFQIYTAVTTGQLRQIGSACCYAITQVTSDCWPKLFPFNPFMPKLLNLTCGFFAGGGGAFAVSKTPSSLPEKQSGAEVAGCWTPLKITEGCVEDIYLALSDGRIQHIGSPCCSAVTKVSGICWSKMFPLNPLFPPLLRRYCYSTGPAPASGHIH